MEPQQPAQQGESTTPCHRIRSLLLRLLDLLARRVAKELSGKRTDDERRADSD
jgi:hypothetical protein